ncbi:MAG: hypothetical protein AVDCRST_MAG89-4234, partial [uncultured Gemmatimonadetes bacterium]
AAADSFRHRRNPAGRGRRGTPCHRHRHGEGVRPDGAAGRIPDGRAHRSADRPRAAGDRGGGRGGDRGRLRGAVADVRRGAAPRHRPGNGASRCSRAAGPHPHAPPRNGAGAADGERGGGRADQGGGGGASVRPLSRGGVRLGSLAAAGAAGHRHPARPRADGHRLPGQGGRHRGRYALRHLLRRAPGRAHLGGGHGRAHDGRAGGLRSRPPVPGPFRHGSRLARDPRL